MLFASYPVLSRQPPYNAAVHSDQVMRYRLPCSGTGKITINKRDLAEYFPSTILQYVVKQPLNSSNPSTPTHYQNDFIFGRLAQLVQSICLTSRGSAVRIRQRPPLLIAIMISMVAFFIFPTNTKTPYSPTTF